ncbi:MAG: KH domain-containing protein [Acidimicrobiales bacterium]
MSEMGEGSMFEEPNFGSAGEGDSDDELEELDDSGDDELDEDEDDELEDDDDDDDELVGDKGGRSSDAGLEDGESVNRVQGAAARAVLEHVTRALVDDPESVVVEVAEGRSGLRFSVHVAQSDMGRLIGRKGRTAQAIRTLVRAAAASDGTEASVDIVD